jgi:hypothetical protein
LDRDNPPTPKVQIDPGYTEKGYHVSEFMQRRILQRKFHGVPRPKLDALSPNEIKRVALNTPTHAVRESIEITPPKTSGTVQAERKPPQNPRLSARQSPGSIQIAKAMIGGGAHISPPRRPFGDQSNSPPHQKPQSSPRMAF